MKEVLTQEPLCISITFHEEGLLGTVSASIFMGGSTWYLNRLLVSPKHRSKGVGSKLLTRLQEACKERRTLHPEWPQVEAIIVEPGGYGSDVNELVRFYKKRGFQENTVSKCLNLSLA
jgi:GNAT superfamily N-acetyltransferase